MTFHKCESCNSTTSLWVGEMIRFGSKTFCEWCRTNDRDHEYHPDYFTIFHRIRNTWDVIPREQIRKQGKDWYLTCDYGDGSCNEKSLLYKYDANGGVECSECDDSSYKPDIKFVCEKHLYFLATNDFDTVHTTWPGDDAEHPFIKARSGLERLFTSVGRVETLKFLSKMMVEFFDKGEDQ